MHSSEEPSVVGSRHPWLILAVVCLSVYVINLDITIVNAALPTLVDELGATNRDLQWIVDAYNLTFAGFVLAAGSLADRYGRRGALVVGLSIFGAAAAAGAMVADVGSLVAARAVMGIGAAIIFPTTLSIIAHTFPDRRLRAKAIGIWGAITGVGVATGPLTGGFLLEYFWWGSVFAVMVPVAIGAVVLTVWLVPTSRDPATPRLDVGGQLLSIATIGLLVYAVIEAPVHGWRSTSTLSLGAAATLFAVAFVLWERGRREPMLDVRLFANLRFSAACLAVTVAWFSLFGFIILITQYFQYFKGFDPLTYGLALAPIAASIAVGSVVGVVLAMRFGGRWVVASGLGLMAVFFLWVSTVSSSTDYWPTIVGQMVVGGLGLGLTTAPATETIMDVVPVEKSAVGSAMNDATRELGGTLGVAVVGSIFASAYAAHLVDAQAAASLPAEALATARESVGAALQLGLGDPTGALSAAVDTAFYAGLAPACLTTGLVALAGAVLAAVFLPSKRRTAEAKALADGEGAATALPPAPIARPVPTQPAFERPNAR
ncbi:MAG: DHA2 family efflux MFS transporter permease subunit [Sporichthyaceae bacterium]